MVRSPQGGGLSLTMVLALCACGQPAPAEPREPGASTAMVPRPAQRSLPVADAGGRACPEAISTVSKGLLVDGADLLSAADERALQTRLANSQRHTQATIVVATVPRLDAQPIEAAARCLTERWTVDGKPVSHGALVLLAPNERRIRIATMPGTKRVLSDTRAARVIGKMTRSLRNGDYAEGLTIGVDDLSEAFLEDIPAAATRVPL